MKIIKKIVSVMVFVILVYFLPIGHKPAQWAWKQFFLDGADFPITPGNDITLGVITTWTCVAGPPLIDTPSYTHVSIEVTNGGQHPRPHATYRCNIQVDTDAPYGLYTVKVSWPSNPCRDKACREYEKTWTLLVSPRSILHVVYLNLFFGEWRSWNVNRGT
jgi:hypothetical protein